MNRRAFITLLGGVTATWPLAVRAAGGDAGSLFIGSLNKRNAGRIRAVGRPSFAKG
jgi:hypothetical protein